MTATQSPPAKPKKPGYVDRWYHPRIWHGFLFTAWLRLLFKNRCRVGVHRIAAAVIVTNMSICHSVLRVVQNVVYGRRIREARPAAPPVFILGHWRSGTTMLHEMFALDEKNVCPNTYECFAPNHFLLTEGIVTRWFNWLMPKQRPMDNMAVGWLRPQEDEFALCAMGEPSPYWSLAFPNHPQQYKEYLDMEGISPEARRSWIQTLRRFVQLLVAHRPGRPVLKSPPHTGRVPALLEAFPDARFIHIVRDPRAVWISTFNMWKKMCLTQGFQKARFEGLEEDVFDNFERMYAAFEKSRSLIPPDRLYEVRYEDLVADPMGQVRQIYEKLELGDFERVRPAFEAYLAAESDYQTNRYQMDEELRAEIDRRWSGYMQRYGY